MIPRLTIGINLPSKDDLTPPRRNNMPRAMPEIKKARIVNICRSSVCGEQPPCNCNGNNQAEYHVSHDITA